MVKVRLRTSVMASLFIGREAVTFRLRGGAFYGAFDEAFDGAFYEAFDGAFYRACYGASRRRGSSPNSTKVRL
ncbi:hypothetical protein Tco_0589841 [Tanacetum coccineum]